MKYHPNLLIIRGTGRNIGKTLSACRIIQHLAGSHRPVAVKISSHFHPLPDEMDVIADTESYVIAEEKSLTEKDSSRMLQSGAHRAYYIQARNEHVLDAFIHLLPELDPSQPLMIESGGLYDFVEPAILVHINGGGADKNAHFRQESEKIILTSEEAFKKDWNSVRFINQKLEPYARIQGGT
jgi:hypothetical protein